MRIFKNGGANYFINYTEIKDRLSPGVYIVQKDSKDQFFLQDGPEFTIPDKIYGNLEEHMNRYVNAFKRSDRNLGVLLNGEKGSGKTLLAWMISRKLNLPVIKIETRYMGPDFMTFMNQIQQPCIIFIDEFDKIYKEWDEDENGNRINTQTELLKLMDSGFVDKKLFILTSNKKELSEYMTNRPSRVRYCQTFSKLTDEQIKEVLADRLEHKEFTQDIVDLAGMYFGFNLDTLLTLIEETNFENKNPKDLIKYMNIVPESQDFDVFLLEKGKTYEYFKIVNFDPMSDNYMPYLVFTTKGEDPSTGGEKGITVRTIQSESRNNFTVETTKEGMLLKHKKHSYELMFKARPMSISRVF